MKLEQKKNVSWILRTVGLIILLVLGIMLTLAIVMAAWSAGAVVGIFVTLLSVGGWAYLVGLVMDPNL